MNRLLIVGAGGHGKVVADSAACQGSWSAIAFVDDRASEVKDVIGYPVVGTTKDIGSIVDPDTEVIVAIGHAKQRLRLLDDCRTRSYRVAKVIHPAAVISKHAEISPGTVVFAGVVVQAGTRLGPGCIINTSATVDHDCDLAAGVHVCPGARVAGTVTIGTGAWLGIGCAIRNNLTIGSWATIGAGAVVIDDVADGITVVGVPARPLERSS